MELETLVHNFRKAIEAAHRKKKMGILRIHPDTAAVDGDVWGDGA